MKFILNKDTLTVAEEKIINSGSVKYYEAEVEYDSSWNDLIINAILIRKDEEDGSQIAVINNKVFLDKKEFGRFKIGFIGYKIENEQKVYQISTNLQSFYIQKGAGSIEIEEGDVPTPTEWEIYIAQIQEMLNNIDSTVPQHVKEISEEDIENWNNVNELENVLQDILEAIQSGVSASMVIEEIEQLIVSYFENKTVGEVEAE